MIRPPPPDKQKSKKSRGRTHLNHHREHEGKERG